MAAWQIPQAEDLLRGIAARNGQSLNASAIGRRLGLSCHAVRHRIAALEKAGVIRFLPSLTGRRPHVLLRDCRLLQALGAGDLAVMRTCLTERITTTFNAGASAVRYFQWETGRVKRIDLVASTSKESIGFKFMERPALRNRDWEPLRQDVTQGVVDRGFLIHCGAHAFIVARVVIALPMQEFLGYLDQWLACRNFREAHELLRRRMPRVFLSVLSMRGCT